MEEFTFDSLSIGTKRSFQVKITPDVIKKFSEITGDKNPLHLDDNYASNSIFGKKIGFGMLGASYFSTLAGMYLPGKHSLILSVDLKFKKPFYEGDTLKILGNVEEKIPVGNIIVLKVSVLNQKEEEITEGKMRVRVTR